jgi:CRP/FNR family transcriptional regulator, cyclic AMP receptor protein
MNFIDAVGYMASSLVLVTFCMRTMLMLRAVAICSNVAFVAYGIGAGIYPVLLLHAILLPLNVSHLIRMVWILSRAKRAAAADLSPVWLQPFMQLRHVRSGETIFKKGDHADTLYMIGSGEVILPEIRQRLASGDVFGEVGLFAVDRLRTQTAVAVTDLDLFWISSAELKKLCERNPGLTLYLLRLVASRLVANAARASSETPGLQFREPSPQTS